MIKICEKCSSDFNARRSKIRFCSKACANEDLRKAVKLPCSHCYKLTWCTPSRIKKLKTGNVFCSANCRDKHKYKLMPSAENHPGWKGGNGSYRQRAIKYYGLKCSNLHCQIRESGIDCPEYMLDVDHKNNNRKDNSLENLQVLCIWCHTKKTRT